MTAVKNKTLKAYLDAKKAPRRLLGDVERFLLTRAPEDRSTTVLHPSEVVKDDWCHRESYFLLSGAASKKERPNLRLQNIFDEGHEIHDKWQTRFADMGVLYGMWDNGPGTPTWWGMPDDGPAAHRRYREVPITSTKYRVEGKGDGVIRGIGKTVWLEIKSIGEGTIRMESDLLGQYGIADEAWKAIRQPFPTHIRQPRFYMEIWNQTHPDDPIDEAVVLYEWKANQSVKEFTIKHDPGQIKPYLAAALKVVRAVRNQTPPRCNIKTGGCAKCKAYA